MNGEERYLTGEMLDFAAHMPLGNDLELIVLKGHLLIERQLEHIIRTIVAHGELLENVRINFELKAKLARAMCWGQHQNSFWHFIVALSTLRNHLAHNLGSEKTDRKIDDVLVAVEATLTPKERMDVAELSTSERLKYAIAQTMGFLSGYIADAQAYRDQIDTVYEGLSNHPSNEDNSE